MSYYYGSHCYDSYGYDSYGYSEPAYSYSPPEPVYHAPEPTYYASEPSYYEPEPAYSTPDHVAYEEGPHIYDAEVYYDARTEEYETSGPHYEVPNSDSFEHDESAYVAAGEDYTVHFNPAYDLEPMSDEHDCAHSENNPTVYHQPTYYNYSEPDHSTPEPDHPQHKHNTVEGYVLHSIVIDEGPPIYFYVPVAPADEDQSHHPHESVTPDARPPLPATDKPEPELSQTVVDAELSLSTCESEPAFILVDVPPDVTPTIFNINITVPDSLAGGNRTRQPFTSHSRPIPDRRPQNSIYFARSHPPQTHRPLFNRRPKGRIKQRPSQSLPRQHQQLPPQRARRPKGRIKHEPKPPPSPSEHRPPLANQNPPSPLRHPPPLKYELSAPHHQSEVPSWSRHTKGRIKTVFNILSPCTPSLSATNRTNALRRISLRNQSYVPPSFPIPYF